MFIISVINKISNIEYFNLPFQTVAWGCGFSVNTASKLLKSYLKFGAIYVSIIDIL